MKEKITKKYPAILLIAVTLSILLITVMVFATKAPVLDTSGIPLSMEISGIQGSGREGTILVEAFSHEISVPFDPVSGLPTDERIHNPLVVTKTFDKASPKLYEALVSGAHLGDVTIKFFRQEETGNVQEHYFTIQLEDAIIVSIKPFMPNILDPATESFGHMEEVMFTYKKIKWTWEIDGIEAEDTWDPPSTP